ncbi:MAG TPA: discoidin domain-containing protein, partial [Ignavibacteriaceae bacterium]
MLQKYFPFLLFVLILFNEQNSAQIKTLDDFENSNGWSEIKADGVTLNIATDAGINGNAIRFDYNFTKGTGYGGIQKFFPIDVPENYEFTFYLKAESPANNFEIKFIDSTGNNVWWVNNRNYDFPKEWRKVRVKKRHINFAWGPTNDQALKRIDRIEFTIASFVGGKGTIWIDDLKFEPLPPETYDYPLPLVTAKSQPFNLEPKNVVDGSLETYWKSVGVKNQSITIDFKTRREFGGLKIDWLKGYEAASFEVLLSDDGKRWEKVYSVSSNRSNVSFIKLTEAESRFLRINLLKSNSEENFGISEIKVLDIKNSLTPNDFLIYTAKNSSKGDYPRYFLDEASFWTVIGVNNDVKEALINEDGIVEVDKSAFSIEPMLQIGNDYFNWANVSAAQSLENGYLPIPKVTWNCSDVNLEVEAFANGEANINSTLYLKYRITNISKEQKEGKLFLLVRP